MVLHVSVLQSEGAAKAQAVVPEVASEQTGVRAASSTVWFPPLQTIEHLSTGIKPARSE